MSLLKSSCPQKNTWKNFLPKKIPESKFQTPKLVLLSPSLEIKSTVQYRKWSPIINDPLAANDPQNGPQMILDRKWSRDENQNGLESSYWIILSGLLSPKKNKVLIKLNTFLKKSQDWNKREAVKLHLKLSSINKTQINANKKKNLNTISKTIALEQQCSVSCLIVG